MILRQDIQMRDPYVVLIDGKYYLYGTTDKNCWAEKATGFDAYVSDASSQLLKLSPKCLFKLY